jgi:hypothetical protein
VTLIDGLVLARSAPIGETRLPAQIETPRYAVDYDRSYQKADC